MRRLLLLALVAGGVAAGTGAASAHCYGQTDPTLPRAGVCGGFHCVDVCYVERPYCFLDPSPGRSAIALCQPRP